MCNFSVWVLLSLLLAGGCCLPQANAVTSAAHLPLEARDDTGSQEDDIISTSYVLPNQIFNDGKPYYAGKDPISGQFDFSAKKPAGIEPAANEVIDPKEKIVLSNTAPNIHDFLNLPVKYSSSKFVYPLVSSSYANLKYQGSNKNYITNKKPTSIVEPVTAAPNYHSQNYYTVPTTKLMAVPPTASGTSSNVPSSIPTSTTTTTTTSKRPTTTTMTTKHTTTTIRTSSTPTSTKYTTTTRKPIPITSSTAPPRTTTVPTRKKFVPTKKYSASTPSQNTTTPLRFPDEKPTRTSTKPRPPPTASSSPSTTGGSRPTSSAGVTSTSVKKVISSTSQPVVFTQNPTGPPAFSPIPSSTRVPDLNAADVYQTLGQKNTEHNIVQKPSMSLTDIFNSLAEEESAVISHNQGNQGFDAQGNLMQPFAPSKPSPFSMQQQHPTSPIATRPTFGTTLSPQHQQQQQNQQQQQKQEQYHQQQQQHHQQQQGNSNNQGNLNNEYVSYQVQQPNVLQYRPIPGAINNVVISPGQNSATFVLGSQQQVGTVEKEALFANKAPVQYGTVINEDIGPLKRPNTQSTHQQPPTPANSNFHQNGNFPAGQSPYSQRPSTATNSYEEAPPEPPSPYQQLPLIGSNMRSPHPPQQQKQQHPSQYPLQQQQHPHSGLQQSHNGNGLMDQQSQQLQPPNSMQQSHQQNQQVESQQSQQSQRDQELQQLHRQQQTQQSNQHQSQQFQQQQHTSHNSLPPASPLTQENNQRPASNAENAQDTKELLVSTNIRFPANDDQSEEIPSGPLPAGPPAGPHVNGHAQPLSLQQIQNSNPVVFPKTKDEENLIRPEQSSLGSDVQIQQHEVVMMNQQQHKLNFPPSQDLSTPSQHMEPPPRFPPVLHNNPNEHPEQQQQRPQMNRPHTPPPFAFNEYTRKPIPGITRPNPDRLLPNILPQFRPNAKIGSGPPTNYNQEQGNVRVPGQPPKRPNNAPQFAHRRQPLMQQPKRYPMNRPLDFPPPGADANRRVYRLPPYGGQSVQYLDRLYGRRPMPNPHALRPVDSYQGERHAAAASPEIYKTLPQQHPLAPERLAAFEEEDLVINDPPQPVTPSKEYQKIDETKLEPVVTLQMLQSQKKPVTLATDDNGAGEIQVTAEGENLGADIKYDHPGAVSQNGLYVVYPMKDGSQHLQESNENRDPLPAIAHIESPTGSEYQNTPFSVLRDQPEEPVLNVIHKKPQSLQQQSKSKPLKDKFPYPIEKPDPSYTELNKQNRVPGVLIAPRIINGAYTTGTVAPIAIAYTPTEPNPHRRAAALTAQKYSNVNLASAVISEIRPGSQTEENLSNDFDLRGQNFERDFMAPFYPSVSLGSATNAPSNGWNILPSTTDNTIYEKNKINRADTNEYRDEGLMGEQTTTKSFELDSFQPELQGGFKPIYPPGYKLEDEDSEVREEQTFNNVNNNFKQLNENTLLDSNKQIPIALASHMETTSNPLALPKAASTTPSTTLSTTTTTTTARPQLSTTAAPKVETSTSVPPKTDASSSTSATSTSTTPPALVTPTPTQRNKSIFETSLEALLFGDDTDFENEEARKQHQMKAKIGPRSAPRMGPRNIKLS